MTEKEVKEESKKLLPGQKKIMFVIILLMILLVGLGMILSIFSYLY